MDEEIEYEPEEEESRENEALWKEITGKHSKPPLPSSNATSTSYQAFPPASSINSSRQSDSGTDTSSSAYTPYRPYSEPRSAQMAESSRAASASVSSSDLSAGKPKYTSSRATPAQLAWNAKSKAKEHAASSPPINSSISSSNEDIALDDRPTPSSPSRSDFGSSSFSSFPSSRPLSGRGFQIGVSDEGFRERIGVAVERSFGNNRRSTKDGSMDGTVSGRRNETSRYIKDHKMPSSRSSRWSEQAYSSPSSPSSSYSHGDADARRSFGEHRSNATDRDSFRRSDAWSSHRRPNSTSPQWSGYNQGGMEEPRAEFVRIKEIEGELLYGFHPVVSALRAGKRSAFYRLYLQENKAARVDNASSFQSSSASSDPHLTQILALAQSLHVPITYLSRHSLNVAADHRPHNGFILDAAPMEPEIIYSPADLVPYHAPSPLSTSSSPSSSSSSSSRSIWLLLDEVVDPQNLGAMFRSAWYFGVRGILLCQKNSAPLSPVTSKSSSGAQEVLHILNVASTPRFLHKIRSDEWNVVGLSLGQGSVDLRELEDKLKERNRIHPPTNSSDIDSLSSKHTLLVIGNEGRGLRPLVQESCHILAKISGMAEAATSANANVNANHNPSELNDPDQFSARETRETTYQARIVNEEEEAEMQRKGGSKSHKSKNKNADQSEIHPFASLDSSPSTVFVDSLNVSNATAVALYELTRGRR